MTTRIDIGTRLSLHSPRQGDQYYILISINDAWLMADVWAQLIGSSKYAILADSMYFSHFVERLPTAGHFLTPTLCKVRNSLTSSQPWTVYIAATPQRPVG